MYKWHSINLLSENMSKTRERTEQKLVSATRVVLDREGYKDISVEKITKEAKVAYGTFYNYFSSLEDAHEAAVTSIIREKAEQWLVDSQGEESPLLRIFEALFQLFLVFENSPSLDWVIERPLILHRVYKNTSERAMEDLVIQAIRKGELPQPELDTLVHFRNARDTVRWGQMGAFRRLGNGEDLKKVYIEYFSTLNIFNLPPEKVRELLYFTVSKHV